MAEREARAQLSEATLRFLDGTDLTGKVGQTILLSAADAEGWPRMALLSVGEVVAVSDTEVRLALYATSRTTAALSETGRGLLTMVLAGGTYKVYVRADRVELPAAMAGGDQNAFFRCEVDRAERDVVPYARVRHGIEYELIDGDEVLERWRRQVEILSAAQWP